MDEQPKPGKQLVLLSIFGIGSSLFCCSLGITWLRLAGTDEGVILALFTVLASAVLAALLYFGTFRASWHAAAIAGAMLLLTTLLCIISFSLELIFIVLFGLLYWREGGYAVLLLIFHLVLCWFLYWSSQENMKWVQQMPEESFEGSHPQFTIRELIGFTALVALVFGVSSAMFHATEQFWLAM